MKKFAIELKWGIVFAIVGLLWVVFEKQMGWHDENIASHATNTLYFAIIAIVTYVIALIDKRDNYYGGKMTWKHGFLTGLYIGIIVAILSPLTQWITHTYISPDYFDNAIEYSVSSGELTQEQAEKNFNLGNYILLSVISGIALGAITAAIVAIFVKKK